MTQEAKDLWTIVIQAIGVLATIMVALLAVFGHTVRKWFFKPKITLSVATDPPHVEVVTMRGDSSSDQSPQCVELRIEVRNDGREIARNCKAVVDCVFEQRAKASDWYRAATFIPRPLVWSNEREEIDLLPKVPSFVSALRIVEDGYVAMSDATSAGSAGNLSLYLRIDTGSRTAMHGLGRGKYLFPIVVYGDNVSPPIRRYVQVYWDGQSLTDRSPAHFDLQLLEERAGDILIRGQA